MKHGRDAICERFTDVTSDSVKLTRDTIDIRDRQQEECISPLQIAKYIVPIVMCIICIVSLLDEIQIAKYIVPIVSLLDEIP